MRGATGWWDSMLRTTGPEEVMGTGGEMLLYEVIYLRWTCVDLRRADSNIKNRKESDQKYYNYHTIGP